MIAIFEDMINSFVALVIQRIRAENESESEIYSFCVMFILSEHE